MHFTMLNHRVAAASVLINAKASANVKGAVSCNHSRITDLGLCSCVFSVRIRNNEERARGCVSRAFSLAVAVLLLMSNSSCFARMSTYIARDDTAYDRVGVQKARDASPVPHRRCVYRPQYSVVLSDAGLCAGARVCVCVCAGFSAMRCAEPAIRALMFFCLPFRTPVVEPSNNVTSSM